LNLNDFLYRLDYFRSSDSCNEILLIVGVGGLLVFSGEFGQHSRWNGAAVWAAGWVCERVTDRVGWHAGSSS